MKTLLFILSVVMIAGCSRSVKHDGRRHVVGFDGDLHANHFDGHELNDSGRAKIDAIPANGPAVVVIHLTRATDRQLYVRRARDVKAYLQQRGRVDAQVRFNPEYSEAEFDTFDPLNTTTACVADDNR